MKKNAYANRIIPWGIFTLALLTYTLTTDSSVSLWDCGEFIATAFKLQVGHPPGAPLYLLLGRIAALCAPNRESVALCVNLLSALASAFTVLFLVWTIQHLAQKIMPSPALASLCAAVGGLAFTFSDTFWFSAVEAEVYALSSLCTAVVFWAMLQWEKSADQPHANRWIALITYLMGLSIGIHLLNLLTIPALTLIHHFRRHQPSLRSTLIALLTAATLLLTILHILIPGIPRAAGWMEILLVNRLHAPHNSGLLLLPLLLIATLFTLLWLSHNRRRYTLNNLSLHTLLLIVGYSSYALIPIRAAADTPINENNPSDPFALQTYMNREQYGNRPLLYGQHYSAPITKSKQLRTYRPTETGYIPTFHKSKHGYDNRFKTLLPRMYSPLPQHVSQYKSWAGAEGKKIHTTNAKGKPTTLSCPTFGENLLFLTAYQLHHMYWRYFMWNFAGRQNDTHNPTGSLSGGNWLSGIKPLDALRLGNRNALPDSTRQNPSHNRYFLLPLILGLSGLLFQATRSKRDFSVTLILFLMTGIAIVLYLNQTPLQARERDYAYVGSFYAFSIWIGLGAAALHQLLSKHLRPSPALWVTALLALLAPGIMAQQNWKDHNRSGKRIVRAWAHNYLMSLAPNAILFTASDNDTFPLWYMQEVENLRTDVRICNLSLLNTEWYIDQMKRHTYLSEPLPISLASETYRRGERERIYLIEHSTEPMPLAELVQFIGSNSPETRIEIPQNKPLDYLPTRHFFITADSATVVRSKTLPPHLTEKMDTLLFGTLQQKYINKNQLIMLDIIARNNWQRPIYFVSPYGDCEIGLNSYLQFEGYAYRLLPIQTPPQDDGTAGRINTDSLYHRVKNIYQWGNMHDTTAFISYDLRRAFNTIQTQRIFNRLATALLAENQTEKATEIVKLGVRLTPHPQFPFDRQTSEQIALLYQLAQHATADSLLSKALHEQCQQAEYFNSLREPHFNRMKSDTLHHYTLLETLTTLGAHSTSAKIQCHCKAIRKQYKLEKLNN